MFPMSRSRGREVERGVTGAFLVTAFFTGAFLAGDFLAAAFLGAICDQGVVSERRPLKSMVFVCCMNG